MLPFALVYNVGNKPESVMSVCSYKKKEQKKTLFFTHPNEILLCATHAHTSSHTPIL